MGKTSIPSMSDERRIDERHVVLIKVALRDEQRLRHLYATNLSKGGLFLATKSSLPLGQEVLLRLVHPISGADYEVAAEVVNVRRDPDGDVKGCGLRFKTFDDDVKEDLFLFVEGVVDLDDELEEDDEEEVEIDVEETPTAQQKALALLQKSLALEAEGNLVGAAHLLARATSIAPTEDSLWTNLRRIESQLEASTEPRERTALDEASGKTTVPVDVSATEPPRDSGVVELDETDAHEPADRRKARLMFEAARDCYRTQDVQDAINYLERALGSDPTYAPPYYALAGMLAEEGGDIERCIFLCRKAVELDPDNEVYEEALQSLEADAKQ